MAVKALYDYDFPSADRQEVYGDDQLVYVHWEGNPLFCSAACFRVPQAMPFAEFVTGMVVPWAGSDPDFDSTAAPAWKLFDQPLTADGAASLADLGIGHKALLRFKV
jgi:phenol hydroxylase P4 protein